MIPSPEWAENAACRGMDPDIFFPIEARLAARSRNPRRPDPYELARAICAGCQVRQDCLDETLALPWSEDLAGMFGGMTPRERVPVRAERRRQEARRQAS